MLCCFNLQEFEEPVKMLKDPTSLCYQLVQQTGIEEAAQLTALASQVIRGMGCNSNSAFLLGLCFSFVFAGC